MKSGLKIYQNEIFNSQSNFKFDTHKTHILDRTKSNTLIELLKLEDIELSNDSLNRINAILPK